MNLFDASALGTHVAGVALTMPTRKPMEPCLLNADLMSALLRFRPLMTKTVITLIVCMMRYSETLQALIVAPGQAQDRPMMRPTAKASGEPL
jgi:hypothetical protein